MFKKVVCAMNNYKIDMDWVNNFWEKIEKKLSVTAPEIGAKFPYTTENGKYEDFAHGTDEEGNGIFWWTNGFWGGMMWLMHLATGKDVYKEIAEGCEKELDRAMDVFWRLHHDVGFMWLLTAVADYRVTGNERSKHRGMHAATVLAGRVNHKGGFIRAFDHDIYNKTIIDTMMNISLLYWASEVSGDDRFSQVARMHADTTMKYAIREDGSAAHVTVYDVENGGVLEYPAGQGAFSGSAWSRGQAWAIYGFTNSFVHTGKKEYLETAKKAANYFISHFEEGKAPLVDFCAPERGDLRDTTAGAAAAAGMIELANCLEGEEKDFYLEGAIKILKALEGYCRFDLEEQSILQNGMQSFTAPKHMPIIYGDYYLMEALLKLKGNKKLFW